MPTGTEYRYRNIFPGGRCTVAVRGEPVEHGCWSLWGPALVSPADLRAMGRGWLAEESRPAPGELDDTETPKSKRRR